MKAELFRSLALGVSLAGVLAISGVTANGQGGRDRGQRRSEQTDEDQDRSQREQRRNAEE